jgi:hypothetical protein
MEKTHARELWLKEKASESIAWPSLEFRSLCRSGGAAPNQSQWGIRRWCQDRCKKKSPKLKSAPAVKRTQARSFVGFDPSMKRRVNRICNVQHAMQGEKVTDTVFSLPKP